MLLPRAHAQGVKQIGPVRLSVVTKITRSGELGIACTVTDKHNQTVGNSGNCLLSASERLTRATNATNRALSLVARIDHTY